MAAGKVFTEFTTKGADKLSKALRKQQNKAEESSAHMTAAFAAGGVAIAKGFAIAGQAISTFIGVVRQGWGEAQKLNKELLLLDKTLTDLPQEGGVTFKNALEEAEKLFKTSTQSRAEIARIQASIARTTVDPALFERASQSALDLMTARSEMSAEGAAQWITTLLGDPSRTMDKFRRAEIQVTKEFQRQMEILVEQGRIREAQSLVISQLEARYAGAAAAFAASDAGRIQRAMREWEDFTREISEDLMIALMPAIHEFIEFMEDNENVVRDLFEGVSGLISAMIQDFQPLIEDLRELLELLGYATDDAGQVGKDIYKAFKIVGTGGGKALWDLGKDAIDRMFGGISAAGSQASAVIGAEVGTKEEAAAAKEVEKAITTTGYAFDDLKDKMNLTERQLEELNIKAAEYEAKGFDAIEAERMAQEKFYEARLKEADRMRKQVESLGSTVETPFERLQQQLELIDQYIKDSRAADDLQDRIAWAEEVKRRLEAAYAETATSEMLKLTKAREAEREEARNFAKQLETKTPFKTIREKLEELLKLGPKLTAAEMLPALEGLRQAALDAIKPPKEQDPFSPVTSGIEDLYNVIRDTMLTENPTVRAIEEQTEVEKRELRKLSKDIGKQIALQGAMVP